MSNRFNERASAAAITGAVTVIGGATAANQGLQLIQETATATSTASIDSKLDTNQAAADAEAAATSSGMLRTRLMSFNGTTWDRVRSGITTVSATLTGMMNSLPWAIFHTTPTTRTDGQGGPLEADAGGNLRVADANSGPTAAAADAETNATVMGALRTRLMVFNGTTWDRMRSAVTTVSATLTGMANSLPWAIFHTTPTTRTDGQGGPLEADAGGNLRVADANSGPTAAAADAETNATVMGALRTRLMVFNGTTWDRVRSAVTTVGSTFTGMMNALPWALFHTAAPVRTDGQGGTLEADTFGNVRGAEFYQPGYEDNLANVAKVEHRYTPFNQAGTTAGVAIKTGAGLFHTLVINTPVLNAVITVYDGTSTAGNKICTITLPAVLLSQGPSPALYDVSFAVGLFLVVATGAADVTISYR